MTAYVFNHPYTSVRDGQRFGPWDTGSTVDLDEADAAWILRDSPGALAPAVPGAPAQPDKEPEPEVEDEAGEQPEAESEPDEEPEPEAEKDPADTADEQPEPKKAERTKAPARNRAHRGGRNRSS